MPTVLLTMDLSGSKIVSKVLLVLRVQPVEPDVFFQRYFLVGCCKIGILGSSSFFISDRTSEIMVLSRISAVVVVFLGEVKGFVILG